MGGWRVGGGGEGGPTGGSGACILPAEGGMPFDDLVHVIETLKERIGAHRQSLQSNETRTRMALIDPLLRALGWDTEDPALVLPEYESSGRADYALLGGAGKPSAIIEAKRLGESLANHRGQMVNYANMSGIPYAGLTDGNIWEFYDVFDRKPLEERRLLHVSIANDAAHECALKLLLLWRANLASGQPIQPSTPVLADSAELQPPPSPPAPSSSKPVSPPSSEGWIALTEFDTTAGAQAPEAIRFARWGGSIHSQVVAVGGGGHWEVVGPPRVDTARLYYPFRPRASHPAPQSGSSLGENSKPLFSCPSLGLI